jgi:predicted alpha-1,6-mannanase (GH76 family)
VAGDWLVELRQRPDRGGQVHQADRRREPTTSGYKNAITNELFLTLAVLLHQRNPAGGYLTWAQREWDWFSSAGLIGPDGLVNDGLTAACQNNGGTTWTYNQGVILGGLAACSRSPATAAT